MQQVEQLTILGSPACNLDQARAKLEPSRANLRLFRGKKGTGDGAFRFPLVRTWNYKLEQARKSCRSGNSFCLSWASR